MFTDFALNIRLRRCDVISEPAIKSLSDYAPPHDSKGQKDGGDY